MPAPENPRRLPPEGSRQPGALPPELADYLKDKEAVCLMHETNLGTVFVVKLPTREISSVRGTVPIQLTHELYQHTAAPVIRTVMRIYDQPEQPLALETFTNIGDEQQRTEFAALSQQKDLPLLFYDEGLSLQLTKRVRLTEQQQVRRVLADAERLAAAIPSEQFDFDEAKAAVMAATTL